MAFKFPLATVLRVRTIREEREERMLQQIMFEIAQTVRLVEHIDNELSRRNVRRGTTTFTTVEGNDVHASYGELASLYHHRKEVGAHLEKLEQLKDMQIKVYETARRDREMLTDMRNDQRDEYAFNMAKREQKSLDDIFGARYKRG
jgi:flagellar export protein FliJ